MEETQFESDSLENTSEPISPYLSRRKLNLVLLTSLILLFLIVYTLNFYLSWIKKSTNNTIVIESDTNAGVKQENCIPDKYENSTALNISETVYTPTDAVRKQIYDNLRDFTLITELINEEEKVIVSDYSPSTDTIVYATEMFKEDATQSAIQKVYMHDYAENNTILIHEIQAFTEDESRAEYKINSVRLSEDGSILGITTTTELYIYNVAENRLELEFKREPREPRRMGVYTQHIYAFSPDNSKLIYDEGYYEGTGSFIYDLNQKKTLEPTFRSYTAGTTVEGWYGEDLIVQKYGFGGYGSTSEEESGFYIISLNDSANETLIYKPENDFYRFTALAGSKLYFLASTSFPSGKFLCNNVNMRYEVTTDIEKLYTYDFESKDFRELVTVETTESSGLTSPSVRISNMFTINIESEDRLVIEITKQNAKPVLYLVDEYYIQLIPILL